MINKIYCFDIDGVLCSNTDSNYLNATPHPEAIAEVNRLYDEGHTIKIFTGRGYVSRIDWYGRTVKQLKLWGVKYHELIMGKPNADLFIDDKATNIKNWLKPKTLLGEYIADLHESLNNLIPEEIAEVVEVIAKTQKHIFIAGNGGSALTASHLASDLRTIGIKATSLCDNIAILTRLANDFNYDEIFSRQLDKANKDDILMLISGSGNSPNILRAATIARAKGMPVIALIGFGGGKLKYLASQSIILASVDYGTVEGIHSCLCHMLIPLIRSKGENKNIR